MNPDAYTTLTYKAMDEDIGWENDYEFQNYESTETIYEEYQSTCPSEIASFIASAHGKHSWKETRPSFIKSLLKCAGISFQTTVLFGILFGVLAATLWWIDLNLSKICHKYDVDLKRWYNMPKKFIQIRVSNMVFKVAILQQWSFACLVLVYEKKLLRRLNMFSCNALVSCIMVIIVLFMFLFDVYQYNSKSYVGNVVFIFITALNHIRIAKYHRETMQQGSCNVPLLALKLSLQFILGMVVYLPFCYLLIPTYTKLPPLTIAIVSASVPVVLALPKCCVGYVIGRIKGVYSPGNAVVFTLVMHNSATLAARLLQAGNHNLLVFIGISILHGVLNIFEKLLLPVRDKISQRLCKRENPRTTHRPKRVSRLIADQTLFNMMTETTAIVIGCASTEIIKYHYRRNNDGTRYRGFALFSAVSERAGYAVLIEFICNIIALQIQTYYHNLPVIRVWLLRWRWFLCAQLVVVVYSIIYYPGHLDDAILDSHISKENRTACLGPFQRL